MSVQLLSAVIRRDVSLNQPNLFCVFVYFVCFAVKIGVLIQNSGLGSLACWACRTSPMANNHFCEEIPIGEALRIFPDLLILRGKTVRYRGWLGLFRRGVRS